MNTQLIVDGITDNTDAINEILKRDKFLILPKGVVYAGPIIIPEGASLYGESPIKKYIENEHSKTS